MAESTPRAPSARVFASTTPLIVAMLLLTGSVDARAADAPGWTDGLKRAAVMGCRQSIIDTTLAKVAKRANKPVGSIPRAERDRMIGMMEPTLKVCDCLIDRVAERAPFAEVGANPARREAEMQKIVAAGECPVSWPQR